VFCITHNVSPDADVVHYSWTYMEKDTPENQREQLIRWAQQMPHQPLVHHLFARGKANTCGGDNQANVDLDRHYAIFGYNAFCIQTGLHFGKYDYNGDVELGINRFGWKHRGDGYHNTTRYGELLDDDDPFQHARKESLGTVYRNWHPGPLGFQIASDAFAYVYTTAILKALELIEKDINDPAGVDIFDRWFVPENENNSRSLGRASELKESQRWLQTALPPLEEMPEPLFCDPVYCSVPYPPSCLNYEKPTFGLPGITARPSSFWQEVVDHNKWNHMVGKADIAIIKAKHDPEWEKKCAHLDKCGFITAQFEMSGPLVYELPAEKMVAGLVFVCGCCGKNIGDTMFLSNDNVQFKLNDRILDKSTMDVFPNRKCVRLLRSFEESGYEKEDTMLLSVELTMKDDPAVEYRDEPLGVKISHVVAL